MDFDARRVILQENLIRHTQYFFKKVKGYNFLLANFHKEVLQSFQDVIDGKCPRLLIEAPPRHGKTEMVRTFCSMGYAQNGACEFMYACSDVGLALDCSSEIRKIVKHPEFQNKWNVDIRVDSDSKRLWKTDQGGTFWAGGFRSPIVGYGAGKHPSAMRNAPYKFGGAFIIDDPLKEQDRLSLIERQFCIDFFDNTVEDRINDKRNTPIIVFMQPLHKEDLGQHIIKNYPEFKVLKFPILDENNNVLVPELYNLDDVMKIKAKRSNEIWQAKYMMNPISIGGNILKTHYLKEYQELPFLKYRWIEVDTAQKTEERHDYTVFQCWGKGYEGGIYFIDQFRRKVEYSELKQRFKDFWAKHNSIDNYNTRQYGNLSSAYVEDKSSGTQIIQESKIEGHIPVVAVQRTTGKYERAVNIALPKLEAGYINIPANADFVNDFKEELEDFTGQEDSKQAILKMEKKRTFDDQVDCFMSACEHGFRELTSSDEIVTNFMKRKMNQKRR